MYHFGIEHFFLLILVTLIFSRCGYCKKIAPIWSDLADKVANIENVNIAELDCTSEDSKRTCGELKIRGYPVSWHHLVCWVLKTHQSMFTNLPPLFLY